MKSRKLFEVINIFVGYSIFFEWNSLKYWKLNFVDFNIRVFVSGVVIDR